MDIKNFGFFDDDTDQNQRRANDFISRIEQGSGADNVSEEEAVRAYASSAKDLPDNDFEQAALNAFQSVTPEQRREFARVVQQESGMAVNPDIDDPAELAHLTSQLRSSGNSPLSGLLGGGGGDFMDVIGGLVGGGNTGGRSAQASGIGGLLANPVVKLILGMIAANAMKNFMGGGNRGGSSAGGGLLDGIFGGGQQQPVQQQPRQDTSGGGGILDAIFGGGDEDRDRNVQQPTQSGGGFRPVQNQSRREDNDNDGGGGILDALFGGGDDNDDRRVDSGNRMSDGRERNVSDAVRRGREQAADGKIDGPTVQRGRKKDSL